MLGNKYRGKGGTFSSIVDATVEWPLETLKGGVNLDWECARIPWENSLKYGGYSCGTPPVPSDLPLNFHPIATRVFSTFRPFGALSATG